MIRSRPWPRCGIVAALAGGVLLWGVELRATQADSVRVMFAGEVRVRSELDARTAGSAADQATLLRTRLGAHVTVGSTAGAFIQISDSRAFGEEENTLTDASADRLDVHQAYLEWMPVETIRLRAGRQELAFGDERLIGPVGWANVTRAFDGVRATWSAGAWTVDAFGAVVAERDALLATGLDPRLNEGAGNDQTLFGVWASAARADLFVIIDRNAASGSQTEIDRYTVGGYLRGRVGPFNATGTLAWQLGRQTSAGGARQDINAYLLSGAVTYRMSGELAPEVGARVDLLSGDSSPTDGTFTAFNTLYATNHPFYGFMDFFLNLPPQTGDRGLVDLVARGALHPSRWTLRADLHQLLLSETPGGTQRAIGVELDLTVARPIVEGFTMQAGYSVFDPAAAAVGPPIALGSEILHWAYLQGTMRF